jgi:hypothetical protein
MLVANKIIIAHQVLTACTSLTLPMHCLGQEHTLEERWKTSLSRRRPAASARRRG